MTIPIRQAALGLLNDAPVVLVTVEGEHIVDVRLVQPSFLGTLALGLRGLGKGGNDADDDIDQATSS